MKNEDNYTNNLVFKYSFPWKIHLIKAKVFFFFLTWIFLTLLLGYVNKTPVCRRKYCWGEEQWEWVIKIPGQQETLQFNKYNDWLQVCIPGHELIAFVFIFTLLIINFTLEAGNSFVKEISLISIGGLFELRRVTRPPQLAYGWIWMGSWKLFWR